MAQVMKSPSFKHFLQDFFVLKGLVVKDVFCSKEG